LKEVKQAFENKAGVWTVKMVFFLSLISRGLYCFVTRRGKSNFQDHNIDMNAETCEVPPHIYINVFNIRPNLVQG